MRYPECPAEPTADELFGEKVADPYRWLEDEQQPRVQAFMDAQDALAREHLGRLPGRDALRQRLRELFYFDAVSAPRRYGQRYFYGRKDAHAEKALVCMREGLDGPERVLLDPNRMEPAGEVSLGVWQPSPDGRFVVYARREHNADEATLYLLDIDREETRVTDVIPGAKYARPSFTPASDAFYYTFLPSHDEHGAELSPQLRPGYAEIRYHRLGTPAGDDLLVYPRTGDPQRFLHAELSRDGRFLLLYVQRGWHATDVRVCDLRPFLASQTEPPWGAWRDPEVLRLAFQALFVGRDAKCMAIAWGDTFYLLTDEKAPRGKVLRVAVGAPAKSPGQVPWRGAQRTTEIISEDAEAVIEDVSLAGGHLAVSYLHRAHSKLKLFDTGGKLVRELPLPGLGTSPGVSGRPDDDEFFYSFSSFLVPPQIFRGNTRSAEVSCWAEVRFPAGSFDPSPFVVKQELFSSRDGTRVSLFVIHRRDLQLDGETPFLLAGYGGFNVSMLPEFSPGIVPFLEAGGGFALANLRGGGEYGEAWHRAGMQDRKQNVFDDFIAAAEFLFQKGYTRPERLAIRGGSNGGLLVGAVITQRPELCRAAICAVPLLDMLRYHRFGSGMTWVPEYGSADDEAGFRTLFAYSPYHRVRRAAYPALLMLSADHDDRVDPMHARKMTARLQAESTSGRPILLRIERGAGHAGADQVSKAVDQSADVFAFLLSELGVPARV